mmetsp:Transcript_46246/g.77097  ORF Transcript_46246/g.77097 Transcript_46246/m.77097 type:complete len:357 (+) Transcript_46246:29-1099(+)
MALFRKTQPSFLSLNWLSRPSGNCLYTKCLSYGNPLCAATTRSVTTKPAHESHLHYEELIFKPQIATPSSEPPRVAVILHGLLGSGRNWRSFTRALGAVVTSPEFHSDGRGWRFLLMDQRNHGKSAHRKHAAPHTLSTAAQDLHHTLHACTPDMLIGHSLGGKVALEYLKVLRDAQRPMPRTTWVLDSMPSVVHGDPHTARQTIDTLKKLPQPVPSRQWLGDYMRERGFAPLVIDWVATNLVEAVGEKPGGSLVWAFNVDGCEDMYNSYADNCMWEVLETPAAHSRVEIVRAEKSLPWPQDVEKKMHEVAAKSPSVRVHLLPKSGHWVQMDNPKGLIEIMAPSFQAKADRGERERH